MLSFLNEVTTPMTRIISAKTTFCTTLLSSLTNKKLNLT